jgi:hypothetical protein
MKRFILLAALPLSACVAAPVESDTGSTQEAMSLWNTTRINFDTDPNGAAIADGTVVDNTYASLGVTLSAIYCGNGSCVPASAYARVPGNASNNGVSLFNTGFPYFDARWGAVEATFASAVSVVSIDAYAVEFVEALTNGPTGSPFLEAYDAAGTFLGRVNAPIVMGVWQTITFTSPTNNIKRVRFSSPGNPAPGDHIYATFDNLVASVPMVRIGPIDQPPIKGCHFVGGVLVC